MISNWGRQHYDDCALMAVAAIVGELTGTKPTEDDVIALASSTPNSQGCGPVYSLPAEASSIGTAARKDRLPIIKDLPLLLAHFGVHSVHTDAAIAANGGLPTGMSALRDHLASGRKVIASVNGETIWDQPGDRTVHDHDVVVTAVDEAAGIVHLNDSATPHPDSQVSLEMFEAAWQTSNYAMVVAGPPDDCGAKDRAGHG